MASLKLTGGTPSNTLHGTMGKSREINQDISKRTADLQKSDSSLGSISRHLKVLQSSLHTIILLYKHQVSAQPSHFSGRRWVLCRRDLGVLVWRVNEREMWSHCTPTEHYEDVFEQHQKTSVWAWIGVSDGQWPPDLFQSNWRTKRRFWSRPDKNPASVLLKTCGQRWRGVWPFGEAFQNIWAKLIKAVLPNTNC